MTQEFLEDINNRVRGLSVQTRVSNLSKTLSGAGIAMLLPIALISPNAKATTAQISNPAQHEHSVQGTPSFGQAPLKQPDSANYALFLDNYKSRGNFLGMIDTTPTKENVEIAGKMLLRSPDIKTAITERARGNERVGSIDAIKEILCAQRSHDSGLGADGKVYTACEEFFLQRMLESDQAHAIVSKVRSGINADFKNGYSDPLQQVAELRRQRDGELVSDLTGDEAFDEMRSIIGSQEFKDARTKELGYEPGKHPDKEVQEYLDAFMAWVKQPTMDRTAAPVKPKDYENRLIAPSLAIQNPYQVAPNALDDEGPDV